MGKGYENVTITLEEGEYNVSVVDIEYDEYVFSGWESQGGVHVSSNVSKNITITVYGDGKLIAVFKYTGKGKPAPAVNLTAKVGYDFVNLTWDIGEGGVLYGFYVYRDGEKLATLNPWETWYNDTNITPGRNYTYYIVSVGLDGESKSKTLNVSVPEKPEAQQGGEEISEGGKRRKSEGGDIFIWISAAVVIIIIIGLVVARLYLKREESGKSEDDMGREEEKKED